MSVLLVFFSFIHKHVLYIGFGFFFVCIIDWEDTPWYPDDDIEVLSSLEEDVTGTLDSDTNSDDPDSIPHKCVQWVSGLCSA